MSGTEILFGVGILCNAMQIITFGRDAMQVYRQIRNGGTPDPNFHSYLNDATISYKEMKEMLGGPKPLSREQQQIVDISEKAHKGLEGLQRAFDELVVNQPSRSGLREKFKVFKSGIKTLLRAKDVENLEKNFEAYEKLLQTELLHRICSQGDAARLLHDESFTDLKKSMQYIITQLSKGNRGLSAVISEQAMKASKQTEEQHAGTRTAIGQYLSATEDTLKSYIAQSSSRIQQDLVCRNKNENCLKKHDQLMASLRYPEMNSRKNQIHAHHPQTLPWLFKTVKKSQSGLKKLKSQIPLRIQAANRYASSFRRVWIDYGEKISSNGDGDLSRILPLPVWLKSEFKCFWISGKPGSGKSTAMKFITSNPLTEELLREWNGNARILVHYFWRPGNEMQHNVKGMLLSLLYQALLDRPDLSQRLWEEKLGIHEKWSYSDWSVQEIESTLCWTLKAAGNGFCIFIDGLDESVEIEQQLLAPKRNSTVLDTLMGLDYVKICVSSREERTFCNYFGHFQLRIHELTKDDIHHFTSSRLEGLDFASESDRDRVVREITLRAEGVFLWVVMVVKNVIGAFRINNDLELLIERVRHTPTNLKTLFKHMWERCGDDGDLESYRATASRYFNLAVAFQKHSLSLYRIGSLLCYAIAADNRTLGSMLNAEQEITLQQLHSRCLIAEKEIRVICNGLLELFDIDWYQGSKKGLEYLDAYASKRVQFIHRCAADFFNDTMLGAGLLSACGWSKEEPITRLLAITLIRGRLTTATSVKWANYQGSGDITYIEQHLNETCIQSTFHVALNTTVNVGSRCQDLIIKTLRLWQRARLFPDHLQWEYPGSSSFSSDALELELLEGATYGEDLSFVIQQISDLPTEFFLDAVPAVMRGLVYSCSSRIGFEAAARLNTLTLPILNRLLNLVEGFNFHSTGNVLESIKRVTRLLYSCYVTYFPIQSLEDPGNGPNPNLTSTSAILRLFSIVLPDQQPWAQLMALYINPHKSGRSTMGLDGRARRWTCLILVNFATAYRILAGWVQGLLGEPVIEPEHIKGVKHLFQPIVIKNEGYHAPGSDAQERIRPLLQRWFATRSILSEPEMELLRSIEMPLVAGNEGDVFRYFIDRLGNQEGLLVHPWAPDWIVRDGTTNDERRDTPSSIIIMA